VISPCHDIGVLKKLIEQLFAGKTQGSFGSDGEC